MSTTASTEILDLRAALADIQMMPLGSIPTDTVADIVRRVVRGEPESLATDVTMFNSSI